MAPRHYVQSCFIVSDLDAAMAEWQRVSPTGPFFVMKEVSPTNGRYRGSPSELTISCAFAQAGPMQIELIQQHGDAPSVYRDMFPDGPPPAGGFHHLCYWTDDLDAEVARFAERGVEAAYRAEFGPLHFGYFDCRAELGCFLEVLQEEPGTRDMFRTIAEAAENWDGSDPVRYLG